MGWVPDGYGFFGPSMFNDYYVVFNQNDPSVQLAPKASQISKANRYLSAILEGVALVLDW